MNIFASKRVLVLIAALAALAAAGFFAWNQTALEMQIPGQPKTYEEGEVRKEVILEETEQYRIDVDYPQFGIQKIDEHIKRGIDFLIEDFKTEAQNAPSGVQYELLSIFDGVYVDDAIISARLSLSTYTGGAHPGTTIYGLNYDRVAGRELNLNDALEMIDATLAQVAETAMLELEKGLGSSFFREGAEADVENYQTFSISKDSVTFIFDEYQVAPYAAGPQGISFARE